MANIFDQITEQDGKKIEEQIDQGEEALRDTSNEDPLISNTPKDLKRVMQELLRWGLIEAARNPNYFKVALSKKGQINMALEAFDLRLQVDNIRGLAFLVTHHEVDSDSDPDQDWSHPLVRRKRFTMEQSLLVAILRQYYLDQEKEQGMGSEVVIPLEDVESQLKLYLGDTGSDEKNRKRLINLLENLKEHRIVSKINEKELVTIRPIIVHLARPEALSTLLEHFKKIASQNKEG